MKFNEYEEKWDGEQGKRISGFHQNHKVIFDYLFKSSYMPV